MPYGRAAYDHNKEVDAVAQNFLDLDDVSVRDEGEFVDTRSILSLPLSNQRRILPHFNPSPDDYAASGDIAIPRSMSFSP